MFGIIKTRTNVPFTIPKELITLQRCENYRFIETRRPFRDLTFKFYADGSLTIIDNEAESVVSPRDLRGESYDFYVRRRLAFIRKNLTEKIQKYA